MLQIKALVLRADQSLTKGFKSFALMLTNLITTVVSHWFIKKSNFEAKCFLMKVIASITSSPTGKYMLVFNSKISEKMKIFYYNMFCHFD